MRAHRGQNAGQAKYGGFHQPGCRPPPSPREFQNPGRLDATLAPSSPERWRRLLNRPPLGRSKAEQFSQPA